VILLNIEKFDRYLHDIIVAVEFGAVTDNLEPVARMLREIYDLGYEAGYEEGFDDADDNHDDEPVNTRELMYDLD